MTATKNKIAKSELIIGSKKLHISDESYKDIEFDCSIFDALSHINYQSIYIIDYNRNNFYYMNGNPLFLCGLPVEEVKAMGYDFYYEYVAEEDHQLLININQAGFEFYHKHTHVDKRLLYSISYDFHMTCGRSHTLVNHQLTPWKLTAEGDIWLALCTVSLSSCKESGNAFITRHDTNEKWKLNTKQFTWEKRERLSLTENEKSVIRLSSQGMDANEIADVLNKSSHTIKEYRRAVFLKLGVNKISEAITYCIIHKLI